MGKDSRVTVVGGRPEEESEGREVAISPGLRTLLRRLAEQPTLAQNLVSDPIETLKTEELTLTPTELTMLAHLEAGDLSQARSLTRGVDRSPGSGVPPDREAREAHRRRLAAQLELVAPFVQDPEIYISDGTRGIRPRSIYPTPYAVAEALVRRSESFRRAVLENARQAILTSPELPLDERERKELMHWSIKRRLRRTAKDG